MSDLETDLTTAVESVKTNAETLGAIINGGTTTEVTTGGGVVPSVAKTIADINASITTGTNSAASRAETALAATLATANAFNQTWLGAHATAPAIGVEGSTYFNSTDNNLYVSTGTTWQTVDAGANFNPSQYFTKSEVTTLLSAIKVPIVNSKYNRNTTQIEFTVPTSGELNVHYVGLDMTITPSTSKSDILIHINLPYTHITKNFRDSSSSARRSFQDDYLICEANNVPLKWQYSDDPLLLNTQKQFLTPSRFTIDGVRYGSGMSNMYFTDSLTSQDPVTYKFYYEIRDTNLRYGYISPISSELIRITETPI
jgi:hypothetical protein